MNAFLLRGREKLQGLVRTVYRLWLTVKRLLTEQFNKNIYTRILFTNVTTIVVVMIALMIFSGYVVEHVIYDQLQHELLRKSKRVNFALQQTDRTWTGAVADISNDQVQARQDLLKFLADTFDSRITVFDMEGNILGTSAEQEVVPGSSVEPGIVDILTQGETTLTRKVDKETGQLTFAAIIPMGNTTDPIENGILLETVPSKLDFALNKIRYYLLIGGLVVLLIIIFISVYLAMHISRPISSLSTAVAEISRGSYILSTHEQPLDEINTLTGQLNKLTVRLQKMQAESSKMEEDRSRLFAEISHELRTPLTAVQGFVEAIRDGMAQDEAVRERYLDTIYNHTVHITRLVDDILALSRLESGNITVEKLPVDLAALAQGVAMSMESAARSRNTSIVLDLKIKRAIVIGDVDRMEQIIRNLLKNAITATKNGTIRVGVDGRQSEVVLMIEDDGTGIPAEDLLHIWDRFYRVKKQRGHNIRETGSGLGLVIVKKLVQLQNGKIDASSQLGKGTIFTISFPAHKN